MSEDFKYKLLIKTVDDHVAREKDDYFSFVWLYIKHMVDAHAKFSRCEGESLDTARGRAWSKYEDVYSEEADELGPLELQLEAVSRAYAASCPRWGEAYFWMEVGLSRARGFTEKQAIDQLYEWLEEVGGYEKEFGEPDPRKKKKKTTKRKTKRKPRLKVVKGGKR